MTITSDATYLKVGKKSIKKSNILFFDRDEANVFIILSGRRYGYLYDDNNIVIPFADAEITGQTFATSVALQTYLETM